MTHSRVWHDSLICFRCLDWIYSCFGTQTWLILYVTWLIRAYDNDPWICIRHWYVDAPYYLCAIWRMHLCDMISSYVWQDSYTHIRIRRERWWKWCGSTVSIVFVLSIDGIVCETHTHHTYTHTHIQVYIHIHIHVHVHVHVHIHIQRERWWKWCEALYIYSVCARRPRDCLWHTYTLHIHKHIHVHIHIHINIHTHIHRERWWKWCAALYL